LEKFKSKVLAELTMLGYFNQKFELKQMASCFFSLTWLKQKFIAIKNLRCVPEFFATH